MSVWHPPATGAGDVFSRPLSLPHAHRCKVYPTISWAGVRGKHSDFQPPECVVSLATSQPSKAPILWPHELVGKRQFVKGNRHFRIPRNHLGC